VGHQAVMYITVSLMSNVQAKIETLLKKYPSSTYPANHICLTAGKPTKYFYFVESGAVKMTTVSAEGKNLILHIFFPQSFFSLLMLITQGINHYDFVTLEKSVLRRIPQDELVPFLQSNNDVLYDLQLRLLKGLEGLLKRVEQSTLTPAYSQVASLLLYFSNHFSSLNTTIESPLTTLTITITHQEIANWLGLSRENVSIHMKALERKGLIKTRDHHIELLNRPSLQKIADQAESL